MKKRKYAEDFKESIVKYAKKYKGPTAEIARGFGVPIGTMYSWTRQYNKIKKESYIATNSCLAKKPIEEEMIELKEENTILKKALVILLKDGTNIKC